jgi:hypothetical protein
MKYFILLLVLFVLISCSKSSENSNKIPASLIGRWNLTEYLADPGDGSGTWKHTETEDYIEFTQDSTVLSNKPGTGDITRFGLPNDSTILFIYPTYNITNSYKIEGNQLTLMGGCIEACGSKYIKQN